MDIRRKVGNRIIRAYLLDSVIKENRIERIQASLRGPKDKFQDFAKFLILRANVQKAEIRILAETGVYENLRIVGTDSDAVAELEPEEIVKIFTDALMELESYDTSLLLSIDSRLVSEE